MQIQRSKAETPIVNALADELARLQGPCVGCSDCVGLCEELIEALVLPDVILTRKRESS